MAAGGTSEYVVVTPASPTPSQAYAAEELARFTAQMTGATLRVQTDAEPLPGKAILLGLTRYTEQVVGGPTGLARLGDDGFRLKTSGTHLAIVGSGVRGTLYGVYELLERYGGCRWYASWHSVIPKHETWTIPDLDETQVPAFVMREPFWFDLFDGDLAARCRANGNRMELGEKHGGKIRFGGGLFVHTFYVLMPPGEFFAQHPEYFSELNGKRAADYAQLCLANPDVLRICTERLLERIRKDPGAKLYSLSQNDWGGYCTCEKCRALDEREGSPAGSLITFVNQVAEAVGKEFPEVWIETLAYQYTRTPPRTVRPRHNVVPRLCTIECDFSLPLDVSPYPQNRKFVEDIKGWSALTDKLYIWDYTTNFAHYIGPHPNFNCLQGNAKFFRDNHVVGLFEQGAYQGRHAEFAELRAWVLAKLLWSPDQDIEALYADFFAGYYGAAAPVVRQYFDALQKLTAPPEVALTIWMPPTSPFYPAGFFEQALTQWQQAEAAVKDDPVRLYNVRLGAIPVYYALICRTPPRRTSYTYADGRYTPTAQEKAYADLARELLARLAEGKNVRVAESAERESEFLGQVRGNSEGFAAELLRGEGWTAAVCAELGGRVCELAGNGAPNVVDPDFGLDVVPARTDCWKAATQPFRCPSRSFESGIQVVDAAGRGGSLARNLHLTREGLHIVTGISPPAGQEQAPAAVLRLGLDLGNASAACVRLGQGPWQTVAAQADQTMALGALRPGTDPVGTITIASPVTGRGLEVDCGGAVLERLMVLCDVRNQRILAVAVPAARPDTGAKAQETAYTLKPLAALAGLPEVKPPEAHSADRFVVEDCLLPIGHYGEWGEHVADTEAEDGSAAKLFGTHFEWCMQWFVDPAWFTPAAQYKARMRIKVEKSGTPGKAFWAGVYDTLRRRGFGQIEPQADKVADGYQWYDVATWTPEAGQYLWAGPGQFDKKNGAPSAVKAVYIDRIELVRVPQP
jgi:hypothetical protein